MGTAHLKGDVLADFVTRRLGGALLIEAPSARDLLTALPEALRLDGPLSATATLGGTVDAPEIAANVVGTKMTLGGQPVDSLSAQARVIGSDVIVDALTLTQGTDPHRDGPVFHDDENLYHRSARRRVGVARRPEPPRQRERPYLAGLHRLRHDR